MLQFWFKVSLYSNYLVYCNSLLGIPSTTSSVQPASYVGNDWVLTKTSVRNVSAKQAFNVVGNIFLRTVIYQVMSVFFLSFMALRLENKN